MNNFKLRIACLFFTVIYFFAGIVVPVFADVTYTYDQNGNMTSDGTNCYTYNDANQLSKVTNCNSGQTIAQYLYDYQGNRIEKKVYSSGSLQQTVYTPNKDYQTVKLASNGATLNTSYYSVNDELAAQKNPGGSKYYYLNDNLGSTSILTNQSGSVIESTAYLPFGQIQSGGTQSNHLYTGQVNDSETNLDYYNARYYDPSNMHFTQPDSELPNDYDPQQLNRYAYVRNNPMTETDPTGHFFGIDDFLEGLFVTAVVVPVVEEVATNPEVDSAAGAVEGEASSIAESGAGAVENTVGSLEQKASNAIEEGSNLGTRASTNGQYSRIGSTGNYGESQLQTELNSTTDEVHPYQPINGFSGGRYIDVLQTDENGVGSAYEAKTGYQSLTSTIQTQIAKDQALLNTPGSGVNQYTWQFYTSPVTGLGGPSAPLDTALKNAGIIVNTTNVLGD